VSAVSAVGAWTFSRKIGIKGGMNTRGLSATGPRRSPRPGNDLEPIRSPGPLVALAPLSLLKRERIGRLIHHRGIAKMRPFARGSGHTQSHPVKVGHTGSQSIESDLRNRGSGLQWWFIAANRLSGNHGKVPQMPRTGRGWWWGGNLVDSAPMHHPVAILPTMFPIRVFQPGDSRIVPWQDWRYLNP
jgi:hypothetical protein